MGRLEASQAFPALPMKGRASGTFQWASGFALRVALGTLYACVFSPTESPAACTQPVTPFPHLAELGQFARPHLPQAVHPGGFQDIVSLA